MTAATAHTWELQPTAGHDRHGQSAAYDSETGKDIAIVYDGAAHGDLIAAAPEMRDALQMFVKAFDDWHSNRCGSIEYWTGPAMGAARAVLLKLEQGE